MQQRIVEVVFANAHLRLHPALDYQLELIATSQQTAAMEFANAHPL